MTEAQVLKCVKAGDIITVRAKNGTCWPQFTSKPDAYRCTVGRQKISGKIVRALCKRRAIKCLNNGWDTEGKFGLNDELRDERGRFRSRY